MRYEILHPGAFAMVKATLNSGETIKAESDAMVSMSANVKISSKMEGGILGGLGRMLLSDESAFFQTLTAQGGEGEVLLAPAAPGDVTSFNLDGHTTLCMQGGAFLAAEESAVIETKMQNLATGLFSGAGLFVVKATGKGNVFLNAFGSLKRYDLAPGQEWVVDTGHLVAWDNAMNYNITKASDGWIDSMTSGEGLVCRFRGPGFVIIQSRNPGSFGSWMGKLLPK